MLPLQYALIYFVIYLSLVDVVVIVVSYYFYYETSGAKTTQCCIRKLKKLMIQGVHVPIFIVLKGQITLFEPLLNKTFTL